MHAASAVLLCATYKLYALLNYIPKFLRERDAHGSVHTELRLAEPDSLSKVRRMMDVWSDPHTIDLLQLTSDYARASILSVGCGAWNRACCSRLASFAFGIAFRPVHYRHFAQLYSP